MWFRNFVVEDEGLKIWLWKLLKSVFYFQTFYSIVWKCIRSTLVSCKPTWAGYSMHDIIIKSSFIHSSVCWLKSDKVTKKFLLSLSRPHWAISGLSVWDSISSINLLVNKLALKPVQYVWGRDNWGKFLLQHLVTCPAVCIWNSPLSTSN